MINSASQKGMAAPVFALLIVPILGLVLLIGVEIAGILSMVRSFETQLDRIALLVGRHLPDTGAAIAIGQAELLAFANDSERKCNSIIPSIRTTEGGVSMSAECVYVPRLIGRLGIPGAEWRFRVRSEVVRSASDLMLLIDSSSYLGPAQGEVWGSEPSSTYFREKYGDVAESVMRTQHCNNPVLRGIKRFAVAAYLRFMNDGSARLGIGFIPGNVAELDGLGGGSPYLSVLKQLSHPLIGETNYRGITGSDHECRQVAEFEFENRELFSVPEYALSDEHGIGMQIWGKAISDHNTHLTGNTWTSFMEGFRYGAGGAATGDIFGNDRELNFVILAGDVPRSGGERFPWSGGISEEDSQEFHRVIASGRNVNLLYLIYAPAEIDTGLDGLDERAASFGRALNRMGQVEGRTPEMGHFRSFVHVYRDEHTFLSKGTDLVRRNGGQIVLRRLQ